MARDDPDWGYTRIRGALENLGYQVGRNTIKRILLENGFDPAGFRSTTWSTFIRAHWGAIAATDLFTVEVATWRGLVRYFVIFVIDLKTRRVEISGIARSPDGTWMSQIARNLTDFEDGFLHGARFLIHDRDSIFTKQFRRTLKESGVRFVKLPSRSPNLNAYAEHYHHERNHQGLGNQLIYPNASLAIRESAVACRKRLGGLLYYYERAA